MKWGGGHEKKKSAPQQRQNQYSHTTSIVQELDPVSEELANVVHVKLASPNKDRSTDEMVRRLTLADGRDRANRSGSLDRQGLGKGSQYPASVVVPLLTRCHDTCSPGEMPRHSRTKFSEFSAARNGQGRMSETKIKHTSPPKGGLRFVCVCVCVVV